ncbi:heterokaryon incompatibility protein-domain-containing protein [Halenospora varia]|nr:heterokaryon incompatibility protein-domain-containing protein [Halenospora varia]
MSHYERRLNSSRKEIRLLILQPLSAGEEIQCSTETVSLLDEPEYKALSYVWGDASARKNINFNGTEFSVTANLAAALYHLRLRHVPRWLWVDALCINQSDMKERNEQVAMMGEIYINAKPVVIWLGEASWDSDEAFSYISEVAWGRDLTRFQSAMLVSFFYDFCQREWFTRLWTMQELVLAKEDPMVGCGTSWTSWNTLLQTWRRVAPAHTGIEILANGEDFRADLIVDTLENQQPERGVHIGGLKMDLLSNLRKSVSTSGGEELQDLLLNTISSKATEARDRIYGLLGMLRSDERELFTVDYSRPLEMVYAEAMAHLFKKGKGLHFISSTKLVGSSAAQNSMPSWIPIFGRDRPLEPMHFQPPGAGCSGAKSNCANGNVDQDFRTLRVHGLPIDVVVDKILFRNEDWRISQLPEVETLVEKAVQLASSTSENRSYLNKFKSKEPVWRTLIANKNVISTTRKPAPESYGKMYEIVAKKESIDDGDDEETESTRDYRLALLNHLPSNCFFITATGFYGIGQSSIEVGDHLAIWFGSPVPFALRPTTKKDDQDNTIYTISGVGYVGGIMDGEMADEVCCENLQDEVIFTVQ